MASTASGLWYPDGTTAMSIIQIVKAAQQSVGPRTAFPVANVTARAAYITALAALTPAVVPSSSAPVRVWRADAPVGAQEEITTDGSTWVAVSVLAAALVAQTTSAVGSITTADVTLVTSPTVTGNGVKRFRIVATSGTISAIGGDIVVLKIKADGTAIRSGLVTAISNGTIDTATLTITHVPAAGTHTYTYTAARVAGTGTESVPATAVEPIEIIVEQIA